jgi:hypothetical protein
MYQDCYVCKDPLNINIYTKATYKLHEVVRIGVCGHMHGHECLSAWLDVSNSCPTCKQLMFENSGRGVSQSNISHVVNTMKRRYDVVSEKLAIAAIARIAGKQEAKKIKEDGGIALDEEVELQSAKA